ncbi:sugar transferase [Leucobacter sp. CSA1]|uniref:Sugar transferase n=1 Tax=Leucobacter chromiisoli TaxID=2796471 RepID=A0A934UV35_9MICO|nr:sugar transferase [Leucobacter chromiisoli]MBK0419480.1 sugar transferase [Leucobacter chromiisoli]
MAVSAPAWERRYARKLIATDIVVVVASVVASQVMRSGLATEELEFSPTAESNIQISYTILSGVLILGWLAALSLFDTRHPKVFGSGPDEYKRIINATFATFGVMAILAFALKSPIGRGYLLFALPAGLLALIVVRWAWRKRLHRRRQRGFNSYRTLVMGERVKVQHVTGQILRSRYAGFDLVGAVTEHGSSQDLAQGVKVLSDYDGLIDCIDEHQVDTLIVTAADTITPEQLKHIGWELESRGIDLIVAASLTDIAGPRIHMRPVADLPLIHVEYPAFTGRKYFAKRMFDLIGSALLILLLSPVMFAVGIAVKTTSSGPVFYSQERVGLRGQRFHMFKFRSMVQNADDQLQSLLDRQGTADKPLHKINNDPRITPVGRFIRRYSLDELPQLFNVFLGTMSLVGPRPQRDAEVDLYKRYDHRRLFVKPGITGLWQVSGRSNLEWEDAIRLDLYYVENWSMTGDLILLLRTARAVITSDGAH